MNISNIPLKEFRRILKLCGLEYSRTRGGHEMWIKEGLKRPITIQTHEDPVSVIVVCNTARQLGFTNKQFLELFNK